MTTPISDPHGAITRRPFAAKYSHLGWGIGLAIFGGLNLVIGLSEIGAAIAGDAEANPVGSIFMGLLLAPLAVYLLRGRGVDPAKAQRAAVAAQRQAALVSGSVDQASAALATAAGGGAALVAYRNLESTVKRYFRDTSAVKLEEELQKIEFDKSTIDSPRLGYVGSREGGSVEIFRDWVVFGQVAHDIDATTRGTVFTDGAVQVTSSVVLDKKKRQRVATQEHDLRTAQLQLTSATWSLSTPIDPAKVNEARALLAQLAAHVETLSGKPVTSADIREMVDGILSNSGLPAAERIRQLDVLRYEHLVSNDEFKRAKDKILGL